MTIKKPKVLKPIKISSSKGSLKVPKMKAIKQVKYKPVKFKLK